VNAHSGITAALDAETLALAERVAAQRGMSLTEYAAEAIQRVAESDADFDAFIQAGIDSADRGELIPHAEVMAELDAMIEKHRARCQR
jgi:predicted transcriptional regulator